MQHVACRKCGAALAEPDAHGHAWCGYCGTVHESAARAAEAAARIAMNDAEVLALLRQHLGSADSIYLAPGIPPRKEELVRRVHAAHLPASEPVLGLYDDALFDSGDDGFVITRSRLAWKNEGEAPRAVEWRYLDPDRLFADGKQILVGPGILQIADDAVVDAAVGVFYILALSSGLASRSAPRSSGTVQMPSAPPRPSARPTSRPAHPPTLESAIAPAIAPAVDATLRAARRSR